MTQENHQIKVRGKLAIVSLTDGGRKLARKVADCCDASHLYISSKYQKAQEEHYLPEPTVKLSLQHLFQEYDYLICIMATGIVVRSLAPVLADKRFDPGVVVLDEKGNFVISLLSGHVGGANQLANELALAIEGTAVITTATDTQNVTALDLLAKQLNGYYAEFKANTKLFNTLLANHRQVGLYQKEQWVTDLRGLTVIQDLTDLETLEGLIIVSPEQLSNVPSYLPVVQVIPRCFVLGMGSRKAISSQTVLDAFTAFCHLHQIDSRSIAKIVSIDLKKNEAGLIALATALDCPFETFSKEELAEAASHYPSSEFVKKQVGIGNVASASAHYETAGQVLTERFSHAGVTIVLARK